MSSPTSSRPVSRAQSDVSWATATETPESPTVPRTLTEQIDHIKALVTRMQGTARQPEGVITAQLFRSRRRSGSHEPVSQAQILHILDSLKRRIRQEEQLHRRPSEIDPETESEVTSPIDEREEELEDIHEELAHERAQREEWLESAEARVDILTLEKEDVSKKLAESQAEIERIQSERDELQQRFADSEKSLKEHQNWLDEAQRQIVELRAGSAQHEEDIKGVNEELRQLKVKSEASIAGSEKKIRALEESNGVSDEHHRRLLSEKEESEISSRQRHEELQDRYNKLEAEHSSTSVRNAELARDVEEHGARTKDLTEQLGQHKVLLGNTLRDAELHGIELSQLLVEHKDVKSKCDLASSERDEFRSKYTALLAKGETLQGQVDQSQTELQRTRAEQETTLKGLHDEHQTALNALKKEYDELKFRHGALVTEHEGLVDKMDTKMRELRAEHEQTLRSSSEDSAIQVTLAKRALDELEIKHDAFVAERGQEVQTTQQHAEELKKAHEGAMSSMRKQHDAQIQQSRETLEALTKANEREVNDLRKAHQDEINQLQAQTAVLEDNHRTVLDQLSNKSKEFDDHVQASKMSTSELEERVKSSEERATMAESFAKDQEVVSTSTIATKDSELANAHGEISQLQQRLLQLSSDLAKKDQAMSEVATQHESHIRDLNADWSSKADEAAKLHQGELQSASQETNRARESHKKQLEEYETAADSELAFAREEGLKELARVREDLQAQLAAAKAAVADGAVRSRSAKAEHEDEVAQLRKTLDSRLSEMQIDFDKAQKERERDFEARLRDGEEKLSSVNAQHDGALLQLRNDQEARVVEMQRNFNKAQEESKRAFEAQLAAAETASIARSADIEANRQRTLSDSSSKHQADLASLRQKHEESTSELARKLSGLEARLEKMGTDHAQTLSEKEELEYKISQLKSSHEQALGRLSSEHEDSLAAAIARSDKQMEERLQVQSDAHGQEFDRLQESLNGELQNLQIQLEEAAELRQTQMQAADMERERALGALNERLTSAQETVAALQGRLDAELTSRAEVERSLAESRRQRLEDDRKSMESREELLQQIAALQIERDTYSKRIEAVSGSLNRDLSGENDADTDDVAVLKRRLAVAKSELHEARRSVEHGKTTNGESELARQNEFLAAQLEAMVATRSTPATPIAVRDDPIGGHSDTGAQIDPMVMIADAERARVQSQKRDQVLDPIIVPKQRSQDQQPISPDTPQRSTAQRRSDRASKTRSFEDYLQQAQVELSELGSVISQNEALFAQKIQEHVGDLQRAKDQMAAEYKEKFDALLLERQTMERNVSAQSAEEFARDRQHLVETYGAYHDEPAKQDAAITNLSTPKKNALRNAEEKLVTQYNQRVVKRKSQIAMKHAEDFQSLTQDYDRRLADLLGNRDKLGGDLSVEPGRFEKDFGELEVMSAQLENERGTSSHGSPQVERFIASAVEGAQLTKTPPSEKPTMNFSKSQLPIRTSMPRTPTSIPRAMPFPGNRSSADTQRNRQSVDGQRSFTERLPHIRQQSTMLAKSPIEEHAPMNLPSPARGSHRMISQPVKTTSTQDFGVDPVAFEQAGRSSAASDLPRSNFSKRKSMRLSSGIMYSGWQSRDF